jgi:hypothetical protein
MSGYVVRTDDIAARCISLDRSRKAMNRFYVSGIYYSRYILIYIGDLGLTGFRNLDRLYIIEQSSVDSRRRIELLFAREKHNWKCDKR